MMKNILITILLIITVGLSAFIAYDKLINVTKTEVKKEDKKEVKETNKKLTKADVKYYTSMVPFTPEDLDNIKDAYTGQKTTIDDINDETKYSMAFNNTFRTTEKPSKEDYSKEFLELYGGNAPEEVTDYVNVKASDMEETMKRLYNISLNNVSSFEYPGGRVFKLGNYYCLYMGRGSTGSYKMTDDRQLHYEYDDNDNLIIAESVLIGFENLETHKIDVYNNTSRTTKIGEIDDYIENYIGNGFVPTNFKHTFKKNNDGNYYWYSTEVIE